MSEMVTVISDGFSVTTNKGTAEELEANLKSEAAPLDGAPEDPKEAEERETKAAAAKLGKKGGEAAAQARAKAAKEPDDLKAEGEAKPEKVVAKAEFEKEAPAAKDEETPGNPRHDAKARIAQLAREKNEAKREAEEARAEVARLKAEREAPAKPAVGDKAATATTTEEDPEPSAEAFESYEQYVKAQARWEARQEIKAERKKDEERLNIERQVEHIKKRGETFRERVFAAEKSDPGLKTRLAAPEAVELQKRLAPSWALPPGTSMKAINDISDAIIDSEQAAQLLVYLSENPDEMDQIERLPNQSAVMRAMGRLEAVVSKEAPPAQTSKPVAVVSQAKPPVKPISGSPAAGEENMDDEDDFDAYKRKADIRDSKLRRVR